MKTRMDRRAFLARTALGVVGAGGVGAGCGLRQAAMPARTFLLKGPVPEAALAGADDAPPAGVLLVRPFTVAAGFDSRSFVIRRGESEYVTDAYHGFLVSPGAMLTGLVAEWVRGLKAFATVTTGGSQVSPTHALEADVAEWYGDYRESGAPQAVLSVRFRLLHPLMGSASPLQWTFGDRQAVPIAKTAPDELVAGWEQGIGQLCRGLEPMLRRRSALPGSPQA